MLTWTFRSLGYTYTFVFLAMSVTLVSLVALSLMSVRRDNMCPPELVEGVEQQLNESNIPGAVEMIQSDDSFLGQVVAGGLSRLDKGFSHALEAMQEVGEEETMKLEHRLGYIALIGSISPMVGLLGTVQGMVSAFMTIARSGSTPNVGDLALNISTALFTTLVGLLIAIPSIAVYNILRNRVQRMTLEIGVQSEALLERFEGGR
jgi:biopolymer transport protein ExbB